MSIILSGCGSKGDLYQVVEPKSVQSAESTVTKSPQQQNTDIKKKSK